MSAVRLPLNIGVDTLWRLARAFALLVPSAVIAVVGVWLLLRQEGGLGRIALGLAGMGAAVVLFWLGWRSRASDVVLDAHGLAIEGGTHGGTRLGWDELGKVTLRNGKQEEDHLLELRTKAGQHLVLAEAALDTEKDSLAALHRTLAAKLGEASETPPERADVHGCSGCGAPLPPSDQPHVQCAMCGTVDEVPPALRERVAAQRAAEQTTRATSAAVERLLLQPGARMASATLVLAGVASALGWIPVVFAYLLVGVSSLDWFDVGLGFFNGWAFTFAFFAFARVALARRKALQVLTTSFAARPPERPGLSPGCRSCGAPLPVASSVVVECAYCGTESVLGLNVRPLVKQVKQHRGSVQALLREQRSERGRWIALAFAGVGATVVGGFWLLVQVVVSYETAEERSRCHDGDAEACFSTGLSYASGGTVKQDDAAAFRYYSKACRMGHGEACNDVADYAENGWGTEEDVDHAQAMRRRSCRLGFTKACEALENPE